jgi:hypothetical protein
MRLIKGQADGGIAPRGWKSDVQSADITTYDDLGLDRRRGAVRDIVKFRWRFCAFA